MLIVESQVFIYLNVAKAGWFAALDKTGRHKVIERISDSNAVELISTDANDWWANEWLPPADKRLAVTVLYPRFYAKVTTKHTMNNTLA